MRTIVILIGVIALVAVQFADEVNAKPAKRPKSSDSSNESSLEHKGHGDHHHHHQSHSGSASSEESHEYEESYESEDDETQLSLSKSDKKHCKKLAKQFKNSSVWKQLSVEDREAIRYAIENCLPPPFGANWDDILNKPELLAKLTTREVLKKIPNHPRQGLIEKAKTEAWWGKLASKQQKNLTKLVLENKEVPAQWKSWEEALRDPKFGEWITSQKKPLLEDFCTKCARKCHCKQE